MSTTKSLANHCTTCRKDTNLRCPTCKQHYCCPACRISDTNHKVNCRPPQSGPQLMSNMINIGAKPDETFCLPIYGGETFLFLPGLEPPIPNGVYDIHSEEMKDFVKTVFNGGTAEEMETKNNCKYVVKAKEVQQIMRCLTPIQYSKIMRVAQGIKKK